MTAEDKREQRLKLLDDHIGQHPGVLPPEVQAMREAAELEARVAACSDAAERRALQRQLADKRQAIALALERLRISGSL